MFGTCVGADDRIGCRRWPQRKTTRRSTTHHAAQTGYRCRTEYLASFLQIPCAAHVVAVRVADHDVLDLRRIEARRFQATSDLFLD